MIVFIKSSINGLCSCGGYCLCPIMVFMGELLDVYDLNGRFVEVQERNKFYSSTYEEFKRTGSITRMVTTVRAMLLSSDGKLYLQQRSSASLFAAGLLDQTIGGHVRAGRSLWLTVSIECLEELSIPAIVAPQNEFGDAVQEIDLRGMAVFKELSIDNKHVGISRDVKSGETYLLPCRAAFYIGYYDGPFRFADGSVSGVRVMSISELDSIVNNPTAMVAESLRSFFQKYKNAFVPRSSLI